MEVGAVRGVLRSLAGMLDEYLGRSRDGGRTFEPVVRWADVAGPFTCDPSLMGPIVCGWQWPGLQDQLQRVADAGAGYSVFVTKHHDGFCLWPTATTNASTGCAASMAPSWIPYS